MPRLTWLYHNNQDFGFLQFYDEEDNFECITFDKFHILLKSKIQEIYGNDEEPELIREYALQCYKNIYHFGELIDTFLEEHGNEAISTSFFSIENAYNSTPPTIDVDDEMRSSLYQIGHKIIQLIFKDDFLTEEFLNFVIEGNLEETEYEAWDYSLYKESIQKKHIEQKMNILMYCI